MGYTESDLLYLISRQDEYEDFYRQKLAELRDQEEVA